MEPTTETRSAYLTSPPPTITSILPHRPGVHTATVIFLHGLGDGGSTIGNIARHMGADLGLEHVKWIIPHAFDIFMRVEDVPSLLAAVASINDIINTEIEQHGIPAARIILGGLSQGGALACLTGITSDRRLGGVFMLSTYVPLWNKTKQIVTPAASLIPIYWAHGKADRQVDHDKALEAASNLARHLGVPITHLADEAQNNGSGPCMTATDPGIHFRSYTTLGHWIDPTDEVEELAAWIRSVLPQSPPDKQSAKVKVVSFLKSLVSLSSCTGATVK